MGDRSQAVRAAAAVAILLGGGYTIATTMNGSTEPSTAPEQSGSSAAASPAADPSPKDRTPKGHHHGGGHDHAHAHAALGDGTTATVAGYRLDRLRLTGDRLRFRVTNPAGDPQTAFAIRHRKPLHLFVVANDLSEFRHVHPEPDRAGTWSVDVPDLTPERHRVVAEFAPM